MIDEKRKGDSPIPENMDSYLTEDQLAQVHTIERFGWTLKYVRRPPFEEPVVIVQGGDGNSIGVLDKDGRLNLESDITVRS